MEGGCQEVSAFCFSTDDTFGLLYFANSAFLHFSRSKKLSVPASVVSRIMGRGGCNITAIQDVTGAHIDVDKQKDKNGERMITIR